MVCKSISAMVKPNLTDNVVASAKQVGATDVIIFLVETDTPYAVLSADHTAGQFSEPCTGIAFVLAVDKTIGFESQQSKQK